MQHVARGAALRAVRALRGISQLRLAHEAHVSRFRLSQFEFGRHDLRPDELARILQVLPEFNGVLKRLQPRP
jgi:transcriptional regulator with XRE-family HTH domain